MIQSAGTPQTLFRSAATAKIRSPEQLDALLPITRPAGWVALAGVGLLLVTAVIWGFTGTILRTADGMGIIVRDSALGIIEVSSQAPGIVLEVKVRAGDVVQVGQVVATLDFSQLREQIENNESAIAKLEEQDRQQNLDEEGRLAILREKLKNQQALLDRGLITKTPLLETRNAIYEVEARGFQRRQQLLEQSLRLRELKTRFAQENTVRTSHAGRVTEVLVNEGNFIQPGRTVIRIESLRGESEALVYVPVMEGKKIQPGQIARLAPSVVKTEEYGYILAKVQTVSTFPITREYLRNELGGDESLADMLMSGGSAIKFLANLEDDPSTPSGYRWSSSRGPDIRIETGTVCRVSVVLERVRPVSLLVPFLRKQIGLY